MDHVTFIPRVMLSAPPGLIMSMNKIHDTTTIRIDHVTFHPSLAALSVQQGSSMSRD